MARSAWREAIAAMREDERPDLEHDLVAVPEPEPPRIDPPAGAVDVHADRAAEVEQRRRAQRPSPDREDLRKRRGAVEGHDTGGIGRPGVRAAASPGDSPERDVRAAHAERCGDDHDAAAGEQLEMDARAAIEGRREARAVRGGQRVIARAGADRGRYQRERSGKSEHRRHASPLALLVIGLTVVLAGCGGGGSSGGVQQGITVQAGRRYRLEQLKVVHPVVGKPVVLSFRIVQPDGSTLTAYKTGAGPHTGVHLILVRRDLSTIVHVHPPIEADGTFSEPITFSSPGPYRIVVDAYPAHGTQPNFQLFSSIAVAGTYTPQALPPLQRTQTIAGYRFALQSIPHLRAIDPAFLHFTVTGPSGKPASFTPWFGALAHAIFFRKGSLDYFHTHVCAPGASACTSALGSTKITGTSATPGKLTVGVLVPVAGTWRLFLQCRVDGQVITAPFTLVVR
jgi:hypothetical protein